MTQMRKETGYEEAKAKGLDNYDRDLEDVIDRLIVECERKITRTLKRLEDEDAKAAIAISVSEVTQTPEVLELSKQIKEMLKEVDQYGGQKAFQLHCPSPRASEFIKEIRSMLLLYAFNKDRASLPQPLTNPPPLAPLPVVAPDAHTQEMINEKLKKAEDLGEQGMVDEAQKALEEAEALRKLALRMEPVADSSKYTAADVWITDQKLRFCDICGAFLSVYYCSAELRICLIDRCLADHFGGKLHLGYMQIREKLAELLHRSKERSRERDRGASMDRDQRESRERGWDYDCRSRDRDRRYESYDREHERGRDRSHTYDSRSHRRARSRSRERLRDYDRHSYEELGSE
ncbi:hypothetical protein RHGRI_014784 [Rhododendron griersonianum]|uniref:Uncharacterized protein n=1 Tax=Rhododendron griersonianum TaxID=479676 RepID=A0AAV6KAR8_9ERIC|nr:hypothetical protein RHGRI_014784 [Rhododendron griersonianum]